MDPLEYVRQFVDEVAIPRRNPLPGVPESFRVDPSDDSEWTEWLAMPSPVTDRQLDAIESEFQILMPSVLREYFSHIQLLDGDFGMISMPHMRPPDPLSDLRHQIEIVNSHDIFQRRSMLPFAQDGNDGGPLCFQCANDTRVLDAPVFFLDHELLNNDTYQGERRWNSFVEMLTAVAEDLISYDHANGE